MGNQSIMGFNLGYELSLFDRNMFRSIPPRCFKIKKPVKTGSKQLLMNYPAAELRGINLNFYFPQQSSGVLNQPFK